MGRSNRQTADYFPHYVGEKSRTKFILEKNWGNDGYAFWFKLLELLCAADGQYYDCWDKMGWEYLLAVTGVTAETAEAISKKAGAITAQVVKAPLSKINKEGGKFVKAARQQAWQETKDSKAGVAVRKAGRSTKQFVKKLVGLR